jgi:transposase
MREKLRFLGMDVHAETIAAAIAEPDGEVRSLGTIPNRMESVRKLIKKLGPVEKLRVCYEVRGDRPVTGPDEGRRPGEDRSARR